MDRHYRRALCVFVIQASIRWEHVNCRFQFPANGVDDVINERNRTGIAEVMGSNPVVALNVLQAKYAIA